MASGRHAPSTPRRNRDDPRRKLNDLNEEFNLGFEERDTSALTPSRRRDLAKHDLSFQRWSFIDNSIRYLYFQNSDAYERALRAFRNEAKAASQKWILRPKAAEPCRAVKPGEQLELQELLEGCIKEVLESLQARVVSASVPRSEDYKTGPAPVISARTLRSHSKRLSTDHELVVELGTSKRVRSQPQHPRHLKSQSPSVSTTVDKIDKVPVRQKVIFAKPKAPAPTAVPALPGRSFGQISYDQSANTSKSSFHTSIFSAGDDRYPASQQSQTTVGSVSQQPRTQTQPRNSAPPPPPSASSNDFFAPSFSDIRALNETISRYEEGLEDEIPTSPDVPDEGLRSRVDKEPELEPPINAQTPINSACGKRDRIQNATSPAIGTDYSRFSGVYHVQTPDPISTTHHPTSTAPVLGSRLKGAWPIFPSWLRKAPMYVIWEFTRICLHCGVDIGTLEMNYEQSWAESYRGLGAGLRKHVAFSSKAFPEPPTELAWNAARQGFGIKNQSVILSGSIDFNLSKEGPLMLFRMNALKLDQGCRLNRSFGADRFLEILMPQVHAKELPEVLRNNIDSFIRWLTREKHSILGRRWSTFFTEAGGKWKPTRDYWIGKEPKPVFKEKIHFFAEFDDNFTRSVGKNVLSVKTTAEMLDWLLQLERNEDQPYLKLFSRIQLGLSKTDPAVLLEKHQIIDREEDILSPSGNGKVMNDGIGRMSLGVALKIQKARGLSEVPAAIQARLGPAKGMWILDLTGRRPQGTRPVQSRGQGPGRDEDDWIETYPSQRKWNCDQSHPNQRTIEVNDMPHGLKSASLNLQFLPILEDRAKDKKLMRDIIGQRMTDDLHDELETHRNSMNRPVEFRLEHGSAASTRVQRVHHGQVPFVGGLPKEIEEIINFLLDGGFDPKKLKYLQDLAWDLVTTKCERLKTKLNIRVGRSAYMYMVVDFWDILEEDEVHVAFSSKFQDERSNFADVLLHGMDVLVARSPAHFVSDVQKVRAVFKPELRHLKDVIVFSAKGKVPLADKLSGGDYDGDKAWVCWDSEIVNNFESAEVPQAPAELSQFLVKDRTTFGDLVRKAGKEGAIGEMIEGSFRFNMGQSLLGQCTNYKERLCYRANKVNDRASLFLSALLSNLVDQPKQGIKFDMSAWDGLRKYLKIPPFLDEPMYKGDHWTSSVGDDPEHIIDYMKFAIVKRTIDKELTVFYDSIGGSNNSAHNWDPDLVKYYNGFVEGVQKSGSCKRILEDLKHRLAEVDALWAEKMSNHKEKDGDDFSARLTEVYDKWCAISPTFGRPMVGSKVVCLLTEPYFENKELSRWSLLKASMMYKTYWNKANKMVWRICGRQLQFLKAMMSPRVPIPVAPLMHAALTVDKKFVAQYVSMMDHDSIDYFGDDSDDYSGMRDEEW